MKSHTARVRHPAYWTSESSVVIDQEENDIILKAILGAAPHFGTYVARPRNTNGEMKDESMADVVDRGAARIVNISVRVEVPVDKNYTAYSGDWNAKVTVVKKV